MKYQLRLFYTVTVSSVAVTHQHNMYVNVVSDPSPGEEFLDITVEQKDAATNTLLVHTTGYLALLRPVFDAATDFIRWELWRADDAESEDYTFIGVEAIGLPGTAGTPSQVAQQSTASFRATNGDTFRCQLMEPYFTGNFLVSFPTASAPNNAIAAYITAASSPFVNKRGFYAVVAVNWGLGQNETLYRRRFRAGS